MTSLTECISPAFGLSAALTVNPSTSDGDIFCILFTFFFFFEFRDADEQALDDIIDDDDDVTAEEESFPDFFYPQKEERQ